MTPHDLPWDNIAAATPLSQYGELKKTFWQSFRQAFYGESGPLTEAGQPRQAKQGLAARNDLLDALDQWTGQFASQQFASGGLDRADRWANRSVSGHHFVPGSIPGNRLHTSVQLTVPRVPGTAFGSLDGSCLASIGRAEIAPRAINGTHLEMRGAANQLLGADGRVYEFSSTFEVSPNGHVQARTGCQGLFAVFDEIPATVNVLRIDPGSVGIPHVRPYLAVASDGQKVPITRWMPVCGYGYSRHVIVDKSSGREVVLGETQTFAEMPPTTNRADECFCYVRTSDWEPGAPGGIFFTQSGIYQCFFVIPAYLDVASDTSSLQYIARLVVYPVGFRSGSSEVPPFRLFWIAQAKEARLPHFWLLAVAIVTVDCGYPQTQRSRPFVQLQFIHNRTGSSNPAGYLPMYWPTRSGDFDPYAHNMWNKPPYPDSGRGYASPIAAGMRAIIIKLR